MADEPGNIFDFAAKRRALPPKRAPPEPPAAPPQRGWEAAEGLSQPEAVAHMQQLITEMCEKSKNLQDRVEELYQRLGVTPEGVARLFANPSRFNESTWKMVQEERRRHDEKLKKLHDQLGHAAPPPIQQEVGKKRKSKSIGQRKKWLSM